MYYLLVNFNFKEKLDIFFVMLCINSSTKSFRAHQIRLDRQQVQLKESDK